MPPECAGGDVFLVALEQFEEFIGGVLLIPGCLRDPSHHTRRLERLETLERSLMPHPDRSANDSGRRNRLCRQNRDDARGRRVATRPAGAFEPRCLHVGNVCGELNRQARRPFQRRRERGAPGRNTALAETNEALDVGSRACREDDRHRRHEGRGDAATAEHDVNQAAADPAVAVEEGVDRLELRVGDCGLGHGRQVVAVEERDEILDEAGDLGLGRRDVPGVNRAVEASADPVLLGAELTWACPGLACHQRPVDRADVVDRKRALAIAEGDCFFHRHDVGCHGSGYPLRSARVNQGPGKVPLAEFIALDPRGCDSLGTEQEGADRLEPGDTRIDVESGDRRLGSGDEFVGLERDRGVDSGDGIWHERPVRERGARARRTVSARIALPTSFYVHAQPVSLPAPLTR
jgi:hypothetical protein